MLYAPYLSICHVPQRIPDFSQKIYHPEADRNCRSAAAYDSFNNQTDLILRWVRESNGVYTAIQKAYWQITCRIPAIQQHIIFPAFDRAAP